MRSRILENLSYLLDTHRECRVSLWTWEASVGAVNTQMVLTP